MKKPILCALALSALLNPEALKADSRSTDLQFGFIENKGQIHDQNRQPNTSVKYLLSNKGLNLQLRNGGFSYDAYMVDDHNAAQRLAALNGVNRDIVMVDYKFHRIDITLEGSNKNCEVVATDKGTDYINYYTGGSEILHIGHYGKVVYKNIYNGIDLEFTASDNAAEYNFIVHPGADPSQIKLHYEGMSGIALKNNHLDITVAHGNVSERIPASYTLSARQPVSVKYRQAGNNTFGFEVGNYDKTQTLVIDPKPDAAWSTYYGGGAVDAANAVAVGGSSTTQGVCITGSTFSGNDIATTGAYQSSISSSSDVFIVKFNAAGTRQWGTYYGDTGQDIGYGIAVSSSGDVVVTGETNSSSGFASNGAHQSTINGPGSDAFIAKFSSTGSRTWGTYFGGMDADLGYSVAIDGSGNVFVSGSTASMMDIATTGTAQTMPGGFTDAFLAKFNSTGALQWGTYAGEINVDEGYSLALDASGNPYLAGIVYNGTANELVTSGAHQTSWGGDTTDYFLGKYNSNNGTRAWGTYYGGSAGEYNVRGNNLASDGTNIYLAGGTNSSGGIATTGTFQDMIAGDRDGFIAKFNGNGVRQWGTYVGTAANETFSGMAATSGGDIVGVGITNSLSGLATTDAIQAASGGGSDVFVFGVDNAGARLWASYFGGSQDEFSYGIAADGGLRIYVGGNTASLSNMSFGGHQSMFGGGTTDAFLTRFNVCKTNTLAANSTLTGAGCFGQSNGVIDMTTITGGSSPFKFKLDNGNYQSSGKFTGLAAGNYQVTIKDDNSCELVHHDTITQYPQIVTPIVVVGPNNAAAFFTQSYKVDVAQPGITYEWSVTSGNGTFPGSNTGDNTQVIWGNVGTGPGVLKVCAIAGPGCTECVTYNVTIGPSDVNTILANTVQVYPNPATTEVIVKLAAAPANGEMLKLYDNMGRLVSAQALRQEQKINIAHLPNGIYNLQIGEISRKIMKQ